MIRSTAVVLGCLLFGASGCASPQGPRVPTPAGVTCESYRTDWAFGDCAYNAVTIGTNGKVYFSVSSHRAQQSAHVFEFDPATRKVRTLWSVDQTVPPDGSVTQGKIHSFMTEKKGELYLVTHDAWYVRDHTDPATGKVQAPYRGGYVLAVDLKSGKGRVVSMPFPNRPGKLYAGKEVVPVEGEAMITGIFDPRRNSFYVLSWPSAIFARIDVASAKVTEFGPMQQKSYTVPEKIQGDGGKEISNPSHEVTLRVLGLDGDGNVYGSRRSGEIWRYDPRTDAISIMKSRMEQATRKPVGDPGVDAFNYWRTIVWDDRDKVFYGIHWSTTWLFRFDPAKDAMEPLVDWRSHARLSDSAPAGRSQLSLAMGPDRRLYGFVHVDPLKPNVKRSVHLARYAPDTGKYEDLGVVASGDKALTFAESCAVAPNGDVYTVGWMETEADDPTAISKRNQIGPSETVDFSYSMRLVRIPAERLPK